jgi:hypothetical protein
VQKSCPHANACLTCPMFVTTPEFLPQHRAQRTEVLRVHSRGRLSWAVAPGLISGDRVGVSA